MAGQPAQPFEQPLRPDVSHLVTEDGAPVDNWFQERQQRLLAESLYASWTPNRPFLAAADVGLFYKVSERALVPDVMVSLDAVVPEDWWEDHNRSYMIWEFGKSPDIVVEIVSNREGGEDEKLHRYALAGVSYCAIYDPRLFLGKRPLRVYALHAGRYVDVLEASWLDGLELGLTLWEGTYEGMRATWLRWCDREGNALLTGEEKADREGERAERERERAERERERAEQEREKAERERERAEQEREKAEQEREKAERERERAERLAERLRQLGHDLD